MNYYDTWITPLTFRSNNIIHDPTITRHKHLWTGPLILLHPPPKKKWFFWCFFLNAPHFINKAKVIGRKRLWGNFYYKLQSMYIYIWETSIMNRNARVVLFYDFRFETYIYEVVRDRKSKRNHYLMLEENVFSDSMSYYIQKISICSSKYSS